jgi:DNA helicase TIP49 (TBP-interacting protein)
MSTRERRKAHFILSALEKKRLEELLKAGQANIWKPTKEGETLFGKITELKRINSTKGKKKISSVLCKVESFDGERAFWVSTVIESKFAELKIKVGDKIAVRFKGKKKNYLDYSVAKL